MSARDPSLPAALGLATLFGLFRIRPLGSPDAWWHLSGGRAVLESGQRGYPDPLAVAPAHDFVNAEWGFDLLALAAYRAGGAGSLVLLSALCASVSFLLVWLVARRWSPDRSGWPALAIASLVAGVTTVRFFPRPQLLFLVLLPAVLLTTRLAVTSKGRRRWAAVAATWLLVALWAQVHLSVFIAPLVVVAAALPWRFGAGPPEGQPRPPDRWLTIAALPLLLLPLTGSSGLGIVGQVTGHSSGEAIQHISDMVPMSPAWLLPPDGPDVLLLELLVLTAVLGAIGHRRLPVGPALLATLGVLMMLRSHRFAAAAAVLSTPMAAACWPAACDRGRRAVGVALLCCLAGAGSAARGWSPSLGLDRAHVPVDLGRAVDALDLSGAGFNDYDAGGFLGWTRYGQARVFIDGRTPIFFDDERYFAARAALAAPDVFERLHAIHDFAWVVVPRDAPLCRTLDRSTGWGTAWIDERRALFLPPGGRPLAALDPCSDEQTLLACRQAGHRDAWELEVELLLEKVPGAAWAHRTGALLAATCGPPDIEAATTHLVAAAAADPGSPHLPWTAAQVLLAAGDTQGAIAWLESAPREDRRARATLADLVVESDPARARRISQRLVRELGDEAPAELRRVLGRACALLGDPRCEQEQGWVLDPAR